MDDDENDLSAGLENEPQAPLESDKMTDFAGKKIYKRTPTGETNCDDEEADAGAAAMTPLADI